MRAFIALGALLLAGCPNKEAEETGWHGEGEACLSCHEKIEDIHPVDISCTTCHGGDGTALDKDAAHVQPPANYFEIRGTGLPVAPEGFIKDFAPNQLDQLPPAYLQFINPGDLRVAPDTCGECHADHAATVPHSIMSTNAGHYMPSLFLAGFQGRDAIYGAQQISDAECDPANIPGSVCELETLEPPPYAATEAAIASGDEAALEEIAYDHYLSKSCDHCHASGYGKDWRKANRSSGCTSCHMIYNEYGFYTGEDESVPSAVRQYSAVHEITANIPTQQCTTCHFQGGRIGLLFQGVREAGFGDKPPNAESWEPGAYGKTNPDFYLSDEDTTNDIDETPPDAHFAAGMHCADCHVGVDVHGDGRIYSTSKGQVTLACEDCHGTVRAGKEADSDGQFRTAKGANLLKQLRTEGTDIVLTSVDGSEHVVPQVADIIAERGPASEAHRAMAPNGDDWSHADSMTCDTCHTSYNEYCLGCHVSMDTRFEQIDHQTGLSSRGLVKGSREDYSLSHTLLGTRTDGLIQSVVPSHQVQMTVKHTDGLEYLSGDVDGTSHGKFREVPAIADDPASSANNGFVPFFQHTTAATPRGCATCHPMDTSPGEQARMRGVYGFGTGEFMLENPRGPAVDALQMMDADGNHLTTWVHPGTGPVAPEKREKAMNTVVTP